MTSTVKYPVRFARSSPESLQQLFQALIQNPTDETLRHATAEELEEAGRHHEAKNLRNPKFDPDLYQGRIVPARYEYYEYPLHQGDDYHEVAQRLDDDGLEGAVEYMSQWEPDEGVPEHRYNLPWGSDDDVDSIHRGGSEFIVSHNPRMGYIGMSQRVRINPSEHYDNLVRSHNSTHHNGGNHRDCPLCQDEVPEDFHQMSRIKYAAQESERMTPEQEEAAFLEAIQRNPEDVTLHHAYADLLTDQGRHGEAAFFAAPAKNTGGFPLGAFNVNTLNTRNTPDVDNYNVSFADTEPIEDSDLITLSKSNASTTYPLHFQKWMERPSSLAVHAAMKKQGMRLREPESRHAQMLDEALAKQETPVRHAAYRAPAGGMAVRGSWYSGGKLIPDLEGDFANPPAPEQPVATPQYPQPKRPSLRERLKAKMQKPLVVSYARSTPESLSKLIQAVRHSPSPDPTLHQALAEELTEAGRHKEAELVKGGRFTVDLNGGGKIVKMSPPQRIRVDRNTRGLGYRELREQLDHGRTNRIGLNLTIHPGENGDIHVRLHGNHHVTMHPNGDHSIWTRGYASYPSTRAVIQRITGFPLNQRRGDFYYNNHPFNPHADQGQRYTNQGEPVRTAS